MASQRATDARWESSRSLPIGPSEPHAVAAPNGALVCSICSTRLSVQPNPLFASLLLLLWVYAWRMLKRIEPPTTIGHVQVGARVFSIATTTYDTTGRLAVLLYDGLRMYSRLSVNVPAVALEEGQFLAKLSDENEEFREPLLATGLFEDTGLRAEIGYHTYELWRLLTTDPSGRLH